MLLPGGQLAGDHLEVRPDLLGVEATADGAEGVPSDVGRGDPRGGDRRAIVGHGIRRLRRRSRPMWCFPRLDRCRRHLPAEPLQDVERLVERRDGVDVQRRDVLRLRRRELLGRHEEDGRAGPLDGDGLLGDATDVADRACRCRSCRWRRRSVRRSGGRTRACRRCRGSSPGRPTDRRSRRCRRRPGTDSRSPAASRRRCRGTRPTGRARRGSRTTARRRPGDDRDGSARRRPGRVG